MEFDHTRDIREGIALPKRWQPKANPRVPYQKYPRIPYRAAGKDEKGPVFFKDATGQPVIFKTARDEAEWLELHPVEARQIAEYEDSLTSSRKVDNATLRNEELEDELKRTKAARDEMERTAQAALDELETMKAQLRAKRALENSDAPKLDMRTKEGRAAAARAAGEKSAEG
jgi:hypothetical protein